MCNTSLQISTIKLCLSRVESIVNGAIMSYMIYQFEIYQYFQVLELDLK